LHIRETTVVKDCNLEQSQKQLAQLHIQTNKHAHIFLKI